MNASKPGMDRNSDADAPDLATPEWEAEFAKVGVSYGKPDVAGARRAARSTLDVHCAGRGPGADGPVATGSDSG